MAARTVRMQPLCTEALIRLAGHRLFVWSSSKRQLSLILYLIADRTEVCSVTLLVVSYFVSLYLLVLAT